jgi:hypothetical protein
MHDFFGSDCSLHIPLFSPAVNRSISVIRTALVSMMLNNWLQSFSKSIVEKKKHVEDAVALETQASV